VVGLKENFEVQRINPEELRLVLRGYRSSFRKFPDSKDFVIRIDLGNAAGGSRFNFFAEDYLKNLPGGMSLVSVYPRMIEIEVEEFTRVDLPVQVRFTNRLPAGMVLKSWKAEPQFVTAIVAKSKARTLRYAQTAEIDLAEAANLAEIEVPLIKSSTIARFVETQSVRVRLEIVKNEAE
jgi:YbbR domain-containing protein